MPLIVVFPKLLQTLPLICLLLPGTLAAGTVTDDTPASTDTSATSTWTEEDCLRAALEQSPQIIQKKLDVLFAAAKAREARSNRLPRLSFQTQVLGMTPFLDPIILRPGTYGEISIPEIPDYSGNPYTPPSNIVIIDDFPNKFLSTFVQITQPIYTSGKISMGVRLASLNQRLEETLLRGTGFDVAFAVKQICLGLLMGRQTLELLDDMQEEMGRILTDARSMREQGLVTDADVLEAESNVYRIDEEKANTRSEMVRARESLRILVGATPDDPLEVEGTLEALSSEDLEPLESLLDQAAKQRPELEQLQVQSQLADAKIRYEKAARPFRPQVGIQVEYGFRGQRWPGLQTNWTLYWDHYYSAAFSFQLSLYDGGEAASKVRQAEVQKEKADAGLEQTQGLIRSEVRQSRAKVEAAQKALIRADAQRAELEEKYRVARLAYETGTLGRSEYLQKHMAWSQARTERLVALFNQHLTRLELDQATGKLPRTPDEVRDKDAR